VAQAQTNLVPNGDFEFFTDCSFGGNPYNVLTNWKGCSTPDLYNNCFSNSFYHIPNNQKGSQWPESGLSYIGIFNILYQNNREFIKVKLLKPLNISKYYCFTCYVSYAENSSLISNNLQLLLSSKDINCNELLNLNTDIVKLSLPLPLLYDTVLWFKSNVIFKPDSAYNYIALGNILNDNISNSILIDSNASNIYSYIYIDNISLIELTDSIPKLDSSITNISMFNAISVNNNNINDVFRIINSEQFKCNHISIYIYNRWGQVIFQSNDINFQWDGTFKGKPVELGAYPYIIEYTLINEQTSRTQTGWIHVLY
jgi:gliding motility-associated-like protein